MRAVTVEGTTKGWSTRPASFPPVPPVHPTVMRPHAFAASTPFKTLGEFPLVLMAMATSPFAMGADLTGEEFVVPVIVGDAGDGGNVGGQGDGRERRPLAFIAAYEFCGKMGRIRGATSVAE